jgi:hemolysin type calcium-binding protein
MRALAVAAVLAGVALIVGSVPARPDPSACKNLIKGTAQPESLDGTAANDRMLGLGGDDRLSGERGNDCLNGGFDSDQLIGNGGDDRLEGSNGDDRLAGEAGADDLMGQQDVDQLDGGAGADRIWGGGAADSLRGGGGADILRGQGGGDRLYGGAGPDKLTGGPGNDSIAEVPAVYAATDPLDTGRNRVDGGSGRDHVNVANGRRDVVDCGGGIDTVKADKGDKLKNCEKRRYLIPPTPEVSPGKGGRTRSFLVKFRAIATVGPSRDYFSISVKGPRGCGSLAVSSAGVAYHADRAVRVKLKPFHGKGKMAKHWCRGVYRGTVGYSRPGAKDVPIGRFAFRVRG